MLIVVDAVLLIDVIANFNKDVARVVVAIGIFVMVGIFEVEVASLVEVDDTNVFGSKVALYIPVVTHPVNKDTLGFPSRGVYVKSQLFNCE